MPWSAFVRGSAFWHIRRKAPRKIPRCFSWQGQKDLNPRPLVLETSTLPTELYPCVTDILYHKCFTFAIGKLKNFGVFVLISFYKDFYPVGVRDSEPKPSLLFSLNLKSLRLGLTSSPKANGGALHRFAQLYKKRVAKVTRFLYGGGSGIRTHVGGSPNGFQDRLVMTTSISLRI